MSATDGHLSMEAGQQRLRTGASEYRQSSGGCRQECMPVGATGRCYGSWPGFGGLLHRIGMWGLLQSSPHRPIHNL